MASKKMITQILASIKTMYPYYAQETDPVRITKMWQKMLEPYSDDELEAALYFCLKTCKNPPTVADFTEKLEGMRSASRPGAEQSWNEYVNTLTEACRLVTCFNYTAMDQNGKSQGDNARDKCRALWERMSDEQRRYVGGYSEFVRRAYDYAMGESLKYERDRFIKAFARIRKESDNEHQLSLLSGGDMTFCLPGKQ